jgi:hypothetical protein
MIAARVKECVGLLMIGEGLMAALHPRGYARFGAAGPRWLGRLAGPFVRHPGMTRLVGAAEALAGYWLAVRQLPDHGATA